MTAAAQLIPTMRILLPLASLLLGGAAATTPLSAQWAFATRLQEARRLSDAGEHERALAIADSLLKELPDQPNVVFGRARALAKAGRTNDAAEGVRRLLRWDPRYARRALEDSAFAPVRALLVGSNIDSLAARADRPIARGSVWAVIDERDLVPEGTAYDPKTKRVLVGSLNKNKVIAVAADGSVRDLVPRGSNGLGSVVGIHVDTIRNVLWVVSNPRFDTPTDTSRSALFAFDARMGAFRSRYVSPTTEPRFFNDLTSGPDGSVYMTDSRTGGVWVLRPGARAIERFAAARDVRQPNGITISADGRHLFVADIDQVKVIPLAGGESWRLAVPDSINVTGIDGLAFADGSLIAHHPLAFWRIAKYRLDPSLRAITGRELIESNTADSRTSTTGEVAGGQYVFIGNSQIDRMNTRTIDSAAMDPIRMYRAPLARATTGRVVVSLSDNDSVAVFDALSLDRLATVAVGNNPHEIAASPDAQRAYVANAGDTTISVVEVSPSPRVVATFPLPDSLSVHDVAVTADGRTLWAAAGQKKLVLELDASTGRIRRRFPIEKAGGWMLETGGPDRSIIVANLEGAAVTLLAPATGAQRTLSGTEGLIDAAATPDGREIWSVNFRDHHLTVFDARSGAVVVRQPGGTGAGRVLFTPDGRTALVVAGGDSTVIAFDVRTKQRRASVRVAGDPKVIALSRDGRRAYVTHPERAALTMIDVAAMTVLRSVPLPGTPDGVAVMEPRQRE